MDLKETFTKIGLSYTKDKTLLDTLWLEIEIQYSQKGRYYHNLEHLDHMFSELELVKTYISDFSNICISVFYHDIIYDASSKNNEEKSAEYAKNRLRELNVEQKSIDQISDQILATKAHQKSANEDINYLLDVDLSILGKDTQTYLDYTKKIRKEYSIYPDLLYKPGRKKVLKHFLELENIFKTDYFKNKYENQTRINIERELITL
jgi:predicted metal-dependent HD superfamily phosphohydrolase